MALVTPTELSAFLPGTDAADAPLIAELQAAAESFVADFCGRDFAGGTFTEVHPAAARMVFLRNYPVLAVTGVTAGGLALDAATYLVHADRGVIAVPNGPPGPGEITATYTTTTAVPPAVKQAVMDLVAQWFRQVKTAQATGHLNVLSVTAADGSATQYPWSQAAGMRLPPAVAQLLRSLRRPTL
jgi:hypothetical protein